MIGVFVSITSPLRHSIKPVNARGRCEPADYLRPGNEMIKLLGKKKEGTDHERGKKIQTNKNKKKIHFLPLL